MNRTKIETCDFTTSPVSGCKHGCWYCYAKRGYERFHRSFEPTFHPDRLYEIGHIKGPVEADNRWRKPWIVKAFPKTWLVFMCSVADLFAEWTQPEWCDAVLDKIREPSADDVIFQLLTKSPEGIPDDSTFPENVWLGVTVTQQSEIPLLETLVAEDIPSNGKFFLSCEPLLGLISIPKELGELLDWIVVGKLTGSRRVPLEAHWVTSLVAQAQALNIPIFVKDSVVSELGDLYRIREFPKP